VSQASLRAHLAVAFSCRVNVRWDANGKEVFRDVLLAKPELFVRVCDMDKLRCVPRVQILSRWEHQVFRWQDLDSAVKLIGTTGRGPTECSLVLSRCVGLRAPPVLLQRGSCQSQ